MRAVGGRPGPEMPRSQLAAPETSGNPMPISREDLEKQLAWLFHPGSSPPPLPPPHRQPRNVTGRRPERWSDHAGDPAGDASPSSSGDASTNCSTSSDCGGSPLLADAVTNHPGSNGGDSPQQCPPVEPAVLEQRGGTCRGAPSKRSDGTGDLAGSANPSSSSNASTTSDGGDGGLVELAALDQREGIGRGSPGYCRILAVRLKDPSAASYFALLATLAVACVPPDADDPFHARVAAGCDSVAACKSLYSEASASWTECHNANIGDYGVKCASLRQDRDAAERMLDDRLAAAQEADRVTRTAKSRRGSDLLQKYQNDERALGDSCEDIASLEATAATIRKQDPAEGMHPGTPPSHNRAGPSAFAA